MLISWMKKQIPSRKLLLPDMMGGFNIFVQLHLFNTLSTSYIILHVSSNDNCLHFSFPHPPLYTRMLYIYSTILEQINAFWANYGNQEAPVE
jgi:hypothetical protein